jgi:hypothetical protein
MLVFVDESEWPRPAAPTGYTLWAAVAIQEKTSKQFSRELFNLKRKFWDVQEPHEFEIKGRLLLNRRAFSSPKKIEFVEEVLSLCNQYSVKAFAIGLRAASPQSVLVKPDTKVFRMLRYLLERVDAMMAEAFPDEMAVLLFDAADDRSNTEHALSFGNFLYGHEAGKSLLRIVDTPFFVPSVITPGIQLADLFAYALAQQHLGRNEHALRRICDRIRELEWRSNRLDVEYPLRGFRFIEA